MPPPSLALPLAMVKLLSVVVAVTLKTRVAWLPLMVRLVAVEPSIVSALLTSSSLARTIVELAGKLKAMVSPAAALRIACRNEPAPLLLVLVTSCIAAAGCADANGVSAFSSHANTNTTHRFTSADHNAADARRPVNK